MPENTNDAGAAIDSVSIDTTSTATPSDAITQETTPNDAGQTIETSEGELTPGLEPDAELDSEVEQLLETEKAKAEEAKTPLEAHLRKVVKSLKYEMKGLQRNAVQDTISPENSEAVELYKGLFAFDTNNGVPTTKEFAAKLVEKSPDIAATAIWDLALTKDTTGREIGYSFIEKMGLKPEMMEDYRALTNGTLKGSDFGIVEVPEFIPREYAEVYKKLSYSRRLDIDNYLTAEDPQGKADALRDLDSYQKVQMYEKEKQENLANQQNAFQRDVITTTETQIAEQYTSILDSTAKSPAFTNITVSSNPLVDKAVKESIITDINALGDENSVLSNRAFNKLEGMGVKVDRAKVQRLMAEIETSTREAVTAEKHAKSQGRDYSPQIKASLSRQAEAVRQAVAYSNQVASQVLAKLVNHPAPKPEGGLPPITGNGAPPPTEQPRTGAAMTPTQLRELREATQKQIAAGN